MCIRDSLKIDCQLLHILAGTSHGPCQRSQDRRRIKRSRHCHQKPLLAGHLIVAVKYCVQLDVYKRQVAKRRASQNIRTVEKLLHWYTGSFTDLRKYCRSHPIRGILLVRAVFYHDSFIQIRPIGRAGLIRIIGSRD